jgi:C4-dicarboxylate-specific signal transduction histidine kinase
MTVVSSQPHVSGLGEIVGKLATVASAPSGRRRPLMLAVVQFGLIWAMAVAILAQDYRFSVNQWMDFTRTFGLTVAAHAHDTQVTAELIVNNMSDWVAQENIQTAQQFRNVMGSRQYFEALRARIVGLPQIGEAVIIAANGDVLNSSEAYPANRPNLLDRDLMMSAAPPRAAQAAIIATDAREGERPLFYLARQVANATGDVLGVVAVGIDAESFARFVQDVPLAPDSWGSLLRADGTLLATSLAGRNALGKRFTNSRAYRLYSEGQDGVPEFTHEPAPLNPAVSPSRIVVATAITGFPAFVTVSVGESAFLAPLRIHLYWVVGIALALTALTTLSYVRTLHLLKRAEAAHRADSERQVLAAIVDTPSALTAVIDRSGRLVHGNARFAELLGGEGGVIGALDNPALKGAQQIVDFASGTGATAEIDLEIMQDDGKPRLLHCSLSRQRLADTGECVVMVGHDETERRRLQETIALSAKLVTLGEITTSIAHELSQPLNVIRISAQNALMEAVPEATAGLLGNPDPPPPLSDPEFRQFAVSKLERIVGQVDRAAEVLAHMRIFSRRPSGAPEPFDLVQACRNALGMLKTVMRRDGIELDDRLPAPPLMVAGHRLMVEQALIYILRNACEALAEPPRPGRKIVTLSTRQEDDRVSLRVADNGPGISAADRERIFEPFFTTKPAENHPGLGLAMAYGAIRDEGGKLSLLDTEFGAAFEIELHRAKSGE